MTGYPETISKQAHEKIMKTLADDIAELTALRYSVGRELTALQDMARAHAPDQVRAVRRAYNDAHTALVQAVNITQTIVLRVNLAHQRGRAMTDEQVRQKAIEIARHVARGLTDELADSITADEVEQ